jgi:hypothetical protein
VAAGQADAQQMTVGGGMQAQHARTAILHQAPPAGVAPTADPAGRALIVSPSWELRVPVDG